MIPNAYLFLLAALVSVAGTLELLKELLCSEWHKLPGGIFLWAFGIAIRVYAARYFEGAS